MSKYITDQYNGFFVLIVYYRLIFDLDNKNEISGKDLLEVAKFQILVIALQNLQIFCIIILRAEIVTTFGSKMVICEIRKAIFSVFNKLSRPNFGILLPLKGSFREFRSLSGFA